MVEWCGNARCQSSDFPRNYLVQVQFLVSVFGIRTMTDWSRLMMFNRSEVSTQVIRNLSQQRVWSVVSRFDQEGMVMLENGRENIQESSSLQVRLSGKVSSQYLVALLMTSLLSLADAEIVGIDKPVSVHDFAAGVLSWSEGWQVWWLETFLNQVWPNSQGCSAILVMHDNAAAVVSRINTECCWYTCK